MIAIETEGEPVIISAPPALVLVPLDFIGFRVFFTAAMRIPNA